MFFWIALLLGIIIWPELTFCVFLTISGYPILGIIAFLTTFGNIRRSVSAQWTQSTDYKVRSRR